MCVLTTINRATVDGQVHHHTPPPITLSHIPRAPSHTNPSPAGLQSAHPAGPTSPTALRVQRGAVRKMSTRSPPHSPHATRVGGHQSKAGNAGQEGSAGRSVGAPKPFLRRKAVASPATTRRYVAFFHCILLLCTPHSKWYCCACHHVLQ